MNLLDLIILAVLASAVIGGYRMGFVVGATAWLLLAQGLVAATLVLPAIDDAIGPRNPGLALVVEGRCSSPPVSRGCTSDAGWGARSGPPWSPPEPP